MFYVFKSLKMCYTTNVATRYNHAKSRFVY